MADPSLTDLRALAEAATPGAWRVVVERLVSEARAYDHYQCEVRGDEDAHAYVTVCSFDRQSGDGFADAKWIAACSPSTILALLDQVEKAEAANVSLRRRLDSAEEDVDALRKDIATRQEAFDALHANRDNLAAQVQALRTHHGSQEEVERLTSEAEALRALVPSAEPSCFCCGDVLVPEVLLCVLCERGCEEDDDHRGDIAVDHERCRLEREQDERLEKRIEAARAAEGGG